MTIQVLDITLSALSLTSRDQPPSKSAPTKHSRPFDMSGLYIMPSFLVWNKYLLRRLIEFTSTWKRSILGPMRSPNENRPPDAPPRVAIPKPNASPIPIPVPSIRSQYEPVARHTRSRVTQTMDQPPPRVNKTPDTAHISRCTRSQTAAMAIVITPAQAA